MLLDIVSLPRSDFPSHVRSSAPFPTTLYRAFTTGIGDTLFSIAAPGYFQLAKEFNDSVDEVASSFSALFAGAAAFTYVGLCAPLTYPWPLMQLFIGSYKSPLVSSMVIV